MHSYVGVMSIRVPKRYHNPLLVPVLYQFLENSPIKEKKKVELSGNETFLVTTQIKATEVLF